MKLFRITLALLAACLLTACEVESLDGKWDPIEVNKSMVVFKKAGGCDTIRVKNYSGWWLSSVAVTVNDSIAYQSPDYSSSGDVDFLSMKGDWYSIQIPEDNKRLLVVKCDENPNNDYRELKVHVTVGDAFSSVLIKQLAWE